MGIKGIWMEPWPPQSGILGKPPSYRLLSSSSHLRPGNQSPKEVKILALGLGEDMLALRKCPVGDLRQAWPVGVEPICHQEALLVKGSACSQQYWTVLRTWGLICMLWPLFWSLALICAPQYLQWALSLALSSQMGTAANSFICLSVLPKRACRLGGKGAKMAVERSGYKF